MSTDTQVSPRGRHTRTGARPAAVAASLAMLVSLAALTGCVGVADVQQTVEFMEHYRAGEFAAASNLIGGPTGLDYQADNLLTSLHVGMALRNEQRHDAARVAFDRAEGQLLWKSDEVASVEDVLGVGLSLIASDLALSYHGNIYEGVLVNTYKALGALAAGDPDRARVELNRAAQRQDNAVDQLAVKVSALTANEDEDAQQQHQEEIDEAVAEVMDPDGPVARRLDAVDSLGQYQGLRNPFTDWLHGVFRLATGEANRASNLLRDAVVVDGRRNRHLLADFAAAERIAQGGKAESDRVWVIHEDGLGPRLDEFRFDIFVPTEHGLIAVGTALPTLYGGTPAYGSLTVRADGRSTETEPVLHLDRYVATEFRAGYDGVVFKAVAAAVIRVLVQAELQKGSDSSGFFGALAKVVVPAAATIVTQADTRIWRALPHTIGIASLPRPADDILRIGAAGAPGIGEVSLPPGRFVIVTVTTTRPGAPPALNTYSLPGG